MPRAGWPSSGGWPPSLAAPNAPNGWSTSGPTAPAAPTDPTSRRGRCLPMPADPIHPEQLDGQQRFRADLAAHLDSLPIGELAELLGELPRSRQQPFELGVLMIALNERLPDAYKLLPPAG